MKYIAVILYTLFSLTHIALGQQIPFEFLKAVSEETSTANGNVSHMKIDSEWTHYTEIPKECHQIDLSKYEDEVVVRIEVPPKVPLSKYLSMLKSGKLSRGFKVWSACKNRGFFDIQVNRYEFEKMTNLLEKRGWNISYTVIIEDLPQMVFESYPQKCEIQHNRYVPSMVDEIDSVEVSKIGDENGTFFKSYHPLESIYSCIELLENAYPNILNVKDIGKTSEGRPFKIIHISTGKEEDKRTLIITAGIHAREWISVSSALYVVLKLLESYKENTESLLSKFNFIIVPSLNPDGYVYTWTQDRLWRKNRQSSASSDCVGIDIDHSFGFHWSTSREGPCGDEYSGKKPLDAVEARIWDSFMQQINTTHQIVAYIDLHSYAQEILYPYAYSCDESPLDEENLIELAYDMSKAIRLLEGRLYDALPACVENDLDLTPDFGSGTALDYMYHYKARWAYQIKLRDTGNHGFLLPSKYIEPVGNEVFSAINYLVNFV